MSRSLLVWAALLICSVGNAGELAQKAAREVQTTPLREIATAPATKDGFLAWLEPVKSDADGNVYFLVLPEIRPQADTTAEIPRPRDVLRISADGKKRSTFSPITSSRFATATSIATTTIALDPDGALSMVVWARWRDSNGHDEKRGQYVVSFDREGKCRSEVEVDWRELAVIQFEAFKSGQFLLRGRGGTNPDEIRLAILSATGQNLQDVVIDRSGLSSEVPEVDDLSTPRRRALSDQMVRGGDGRIYVTQAGERPGENVVYGVNESGESEKMFTLRRMPGDPPLRGLKAAGSRLAAAYREGEGAGVTARWWIAVYSNSPTDLASPLAVYGPVPGGLISYQQGDSGDRLTFLKEGNFVTMSSP